MSHPHRSDPVPPAGPPARREDLALMAFERTRTPIVVSDSSQPDNPIILANEAFLAMSGYAADEVIGRNCRFMQGPDTNPEAVARIRDAVASERETVVDILNYRKDGTGFWNRLFLSPIDSDDGTVRYFFASQHDVTEERQLHELEAIEHRLLREVDHRAKNALALVQGIVRLTRADTMENYSRSIEGRVDALAQAHTMLADAHWQDIPLDRVIAAMAPVGGGVTSVGPALTVAAAQVQPLMLLLYEIFANAVQHGSLSVAGGQVAVTWRAEAGTIVLDLVETGGPPIGAWVPGFGLTMVEAFAKRQLQGTIDFAWRDAGLMTTIVMPNLGRPPSTRAARDVPA